jgi:hypothetical protein
MPLDDQLYPEDGSLLTCLDNLLIKSAGKVGERYQQATGNSYKTLVQESYELAARLGLCSMVFIPFYQQYMERLQNTRYESPIVEEERYAALGQDRKTGKYRRFVNSMVSIGLFQGFMMMSMLSYLAGREIVMAGAAVSSLSGVSFLISTFADYLSKAELPPPQVHFAREPVRATALPAEERL